ncbi:hypothetical protein DSL72_005821 [Monilinia vaccinii-corymbosi]|uniref:Uncharacterized protein n=1 Tax=Monilinia vaccinii-corymbosi TaxID=61207 RepID=A0A8A3PGV5_9HELO|nr:hypothetical protein DSL72_005821 [Monilinia vaccinii-corymbosi]
MNPSTKRKRDDDISSQSKTSNEANGIRSLPNELLGQIVKEVMNHGILDMRTRNRTRSLPAFIHSLRCDVGHPGRQQYIFALDACNRGFIHSLHFGNCWDLVDMDREELQTIRNVVVKFLPVHPYKQGADTLHTWDQIKLASLAGNGDLAEKMREEVVDVEAGRSSFPSPSVLKSSLEGLPNLCSVQLEFKGSSSPAGKEAFMGMFRRLKAFLADNKDYKLEDLTVEHRGRKRLRRREQAGGWIIGDNFIKRIAIPEITKMVGREVGLVVTSDDRWNETIWQLEDVTNQEIAFKNILHQNVENMAADVFVVPSVLHRLFQSNWTWLLERDVQQ